MSHVVFDPLFQIFIISPDDSCSTKRSRICKILMENFCWFDENDVSPSPVLVYVLKTASK